MLTESGEQWRRPHLSRGLRSLRPLVLTLIGLLLLAPADGLRAQTETGPLTQLRIGVLSTEGATRALEAWAPTAEFLNDAARSQQQPYRFSVEPHTLASLSTAVQSGELEFVLTDPASFVAAEVEDGARALLSLATMWEGHTYDMTGALIFTRAETPLRDIRQLEGRRVMAVDPGDFGGWWLAAQEFRKHRMDPGADLSELVFSGGNQREVVYAVQTGLVDAGVIRAGVLEGLAAQGTIDLDDFAPVAAMPVGDYPFWVSTPLYPEWVLSALPDVAEPALAMVINALLTVSVDSPQAQAAGGAVWQAPQNYQQVHDLLISLRVRPYENYLLQAANRIFRSYRVPILGGSVLILLSLLFLAYELRRNIQLAEARRDVLRSEARSKKFYRNAIEEHTVFCMLTREGHISHVNDRFCATADRSRQGLLNRKLVDFVSDHDRAVLQDGIMAAMKAGTPWNGPLTLLKEDGTASFVQCTCIPVTGTDDKLSEVAVVATDVTKTRKGISEERFNDTLELIEDQVLVLRPGTLEMLYCNKAAAQRLIRDRVGGKWKSKRVGDFITRDDLRALELRRDALIEGPQRRITWEVTSKAGVPYEISLEYVQPDQDEPRLIAIYRDITQRKIAEKAKNEFISTVSHELRTPLTSMKGALGLAMSGSIGEMSDPVKKMVSMASTNCDRLVMLINDILDLEKIEAGKMDFRMEPLNLAVLIGSAIEANSFYADKFGVTLRSQIDDRDGELITMGDRNRLMQVMDNLLSNASKFSPKGAEIVIWLRPHQGALRLSVRDFGSGIPKAAQPTIFEKFTQADSSDTRAKGGTGLGLSIAKLIVEEHDGGIFFASEEGLGTEFFVDLPRLENDVLLPVPVPVPDAQERGAPVFSDIRSDSAAVAKIDGFAELLALLRQRGLQVEVEPNRVTTGQVVKGVGLLGQSSVPVWLSEQARALLAGLCERGLLDNRPVSVLEVSGAGEEQSDVLLQPSGQAEVLTDWLARIRGGVALRVLQVDSDPSAALPSGDEVAVVRAADMGQALALTQEERFDLLVHGDYTGETWITAVMPIAAGRLPGHLPVVLIAARGAVAETGRGVVSKFSRPSGASRGKARRWAARS